jgi:SOS-response transcriptional repressor LexA
MILTLNWNTKSFIERGMALEVGITPTIVLEEIYQRTERKREFTPMTLDEIQENIDFLTMNKIQYAIKILQEKGFLEIKNDKRNGKRINAYKINEEKVIEIFRRD